MEEREVLGEICGGEIPVMQSLTTSRDVGKRSTVDKKKKISSFNCGKERYVTNHNIKTNLR